ncbi:Tripartite DNA replication factor [Gamsiella multidivaricata]|nr:Tripartite DNA replication factor [Gamsiella multidivaricata]
MLGGEGDVGVWNECQERISELDNITDLEQGRHRETRMSFNSETIESMRASSAFADLLQRLSLADPTSERDGSTSNDTGKKFGAQITPTVDYTLAREQTELSSQRSSLDFSFSSLHISAEEWEEIDRESSGIASTVLPPKDDTDVSLTVSKASRAETAVDAVNIEISRQVPAHGKFKYSPSVLAHHANTACEKMLHLKGAQLWQEALQPKPGHTDNGRSREPATIAEATMTRGIVFESRLQESIPKKVDCEAEQDKDSFFRLAISDYGTTLCQAIFSLDDSFYTPEMKEAGIVFGRFIPDFIRILRGTLRPDGTHKKRLYIIDAKSSSYIKVSHQFQVTLYAIFLDHLIKLHGQQDLVEVDFRGGVWIPQHEEPTTFSLAFMRPVVEEFIFRDLPAILKKPLRSVVWHIDNSCHQCEFLPRCKGDALEEKTLSVIPLLSKRSALWIKSMFKTSVAPQTEIEDLEDLIKDHAHLSDLHKSSFTKVLHMNEDRDSVLLASYRERAVKVLPLRTLDLPRQYWDRLFINILTDPMTLLPYGYSLDTFKERSTYPTRSVSKVIPYSPYQDSTRAPAHIQLTLELVDTLYECLLHISEIKPKPPVLSIFFYSQAMQSDLHALLLKVISHKPEGVYTWPAVIRSRAMDLLTNMYEDPSFLTLSEIAGTNIRLPDMLQLTQGYKNSYPMHDKRLFSIETAIQRFLVLPVIGSYSFKDIMTHLVDVEAPAIISDRDRDDDGYNLDAFYQRWTNGTSPGDECGDLSMFLLAPQTSFKMRRHLKIQHTVLAQFAFFQQWEAIVLAEKRRWMRITQTRDEAMHNQYLFRCRFLRRHIGPLPGAEPSTRAVSRTPSNTPSSEYIGMFEVTSKLEPGVFVGDTFKKWILSPDNAAGLRERMQFDDISALLRGYGRGSPAIAHVAHYDPEFKIVYVSGAYSNMTEALGLTEGEYYLLERREFCPTLTTSMDKLVEINGNCRLFLELMRDPNKWGLQRPEQYMDIFLESMTRPARQYDMTISQEQAFSKVINNRMQVIWGPPGSGKTHFLALAVLRFIDILRSLSNKEKGQGPQTIVLTAFTHTAINNLVARVAKLHDLIAPHMESEPLIRPLVLYRLGDPSSINIKGATVVDPLNLTKLQRQVEDDGNPDIVRVVCGTVWQIRKAAHPEKGAEYMRNIQMLMIDEGSQLLAADAIHAIECLDPERGRLIVAGDHLQLGPVIMGTYPASEHAIDATGSIMKNLMRKRDNTSVSLEWIEGSVAMDIGPCTSQLQENFRMNRQLGTFMQRVYGPSYQVQTPGKSLPYSGGFRGSSFPPEIRRTLDPDRSAICIELQLTDDACQESVSVRSDSRAAAYLEAVFVAGIVEYYLEMVGQDTITSLFVAVPHHIQRLAILDKIQLPELEQKYPLAQIKVDTIEKMQGQEADLVVVCFALFNESTLVNEFAYLYSVHRWIVALSRARCKTVLLSTPQLKSPNIMGGAGKANPGDLESLDGWGLLQAYDKYAEDLGGKLVWPVSREFLQGIGMQGA